MTEAVEGPPRTSCAVRQPPRNRTSRPCFCAAASLLQRMRLPPFFALYSPFLRPSFPFFSLLPFCVFLHASPPGGVRARGGQKKAPGRKESSPAKHPCSNRYGRVALRLPQRLRRAFFTQKREKLVLENQFTRFFCMRSRMMIATKFMAKTSATSSSPVLYCIGRVFSISVPAVASTYMW